MDPHINKERGYTLIELIIVIVILGILTATAMPSMGDLSPQYRLRSGARLVGSSINWAKSLAGMKSKDIGLHYNFEERSFWIILPPDPEDDPQLPLEDRPTLSPVFLPKGVFFEKILLPDGGVLSSGQTNILFDRHGHAGSHIVYVRNETELLISVKFNSLLGVVDYSNSEEKFKTF